MRKSNGNEAYILQVVFFAGIFFISTNAAAQNLLEEFGGIYPNSPSSFNAIKRSINSLF